MSESPATGGVPKFKGYVLFTGPFAFRRIFLYVVVPLLVLTVFVIVKQDATPRPTREKLTALALSDLMTRAMLHVRGATITAGDTTLRVDSSGNYEKTDTSSNGTVNEIVRGSSVYFRADEKALAYWLTNGGAPLSTSRANAFATNYAKRWFTTGRVASGADNPPANPTNASDIYRYLAQGTSAGAQLEPPVTDGKRLTIPLLMKNGTTWFIPATGNASPLTATFYLASTSGDLNYAYGFTFAYDTGAVSVPRAVSAPRPMAASWNTTFGDPTINRLTFLGLLYLASN